MTVEEENLIKQIKELAQLLPEKSKEEMAQILAYWEKIKAEWEKKKEEFWSNHDREDFFRLLNYRKWHKDEIEWRYKYVGEMKWLEREKFIEEYLYDDILYGWELESWTDWKTYGPEDMTNWKISIEEKTHLFFWDNEIWDEWIIKIVKDLELKEGVSLNFSYNKIWVECVEAISKIELKEGVEVDLDWTKIWNEWAEIVAKNMKLKEWVVLHLKRNEIWAEWAKAIAENMELKEWVILDFGFNEIWPEWVKALSNMELKDNVRLIMYANQLWDEWAQYLIDCMELKNWMKIDLRWNNISPNMQKNLKDWEEKQKIKWINCMVEI